MKNSSAGAFYKWWSISAVTVYLIGVYWLLRFRKRIHPPFKFTKILTEKFRDKYRGSVSDFSHESNNCWLATVPGFILSDKESFSTLTLLEDGRPLSPSHAPHTVIREVGKGAHSHWGNTIYFSTSDNSDPRVNGRTYEVSEY